MDIVHLGTEGDAVQARQLFAEQAAFQASVDSHHLGRGAEHLLISGHGQVPQGGICPILPCGIVAHLAVAGIVEIGQFLQPGQQRNFFIVDRAADREDELHFLAGVDDAQIQTGLDQAFDILAHLLDAVGSGAQQCDDLGSLLRGDGVAAESVHVIAVDLHIRLVILLTDLLLQLGSHIVDPLQAHTQRHQIHRAGTGNGVVLGTAGDGGNGQGHHLLHTA